MEMDRSAVLEEIHEDRFHITTDMRPDGYWVYLTDMRDGLWEATITDADGKPLWSTNPETWELDCESKLFTTVVGRDARGAAYDMVDTCEDYVFRAFWVKIKVPTSELHKAGYRAAATARKIAKGRKVLRLTSGSTIGSEVSEFRAYYTFGKKDN